jgi:hypothetical protein
MLPPHQTGPISWPCWISVQQGMYVPDGGSPINEIVRQQWNFSPPETIREVEEYHVELPSVTVLELVIKPDVGRGVARASLKNFRLS